MPHRFLFALAGVVAVAATATAGATAARSFTTLNPGQPANLKEAVPVTYVFVGYEPVQVPEAAFRAGLPGSSSPVVRSRLWYGVTEEVGLHYTYNHRVVYTDNGYENSFFAALAGMAVPESSVDGQTRTLFQDLYNDQMRNVLNVGTNYFIDGPAVEKWLYQHPPAGVDPSRNTVFFVNWWGRPNFKFHTYTKFGEPDPDTGYDFGLNRQTRKLIAWGGTGANDEETGFGASSRLWFYDLSAGPESWTDNWNVDDPDLDGDGVEEYRMPPVWEYLTPGGYRSAAALAGDLSKIARYVAINLLFTSSPLYPPYITPNLHPSHVNLDVNTYEGLPGVDASRKYQQPDLLLRETRELDRNRYSVDNEDIPFKGKARDCYVEWVMGVPCYPTMPYPAFANLFLYNALTQDKWRSEDDDDDDDEGRRTYEAGLFNYATTDDISSGFLGFADDNYLDGTQSGVFSFLSPGIIAAGYGLTTTQIHEYGHHSGMSHPHDGYDSATGVDYGPAGATYYAWSGDESNTMMSYIDVNWDFSQFDLDNMNRFRAAAYLKMANAIAADVLESDDADDAARDLRRADEEFAQAKEALEAHDYVKAHDRALAGYERVLRAADEADVDVKASQRGWKVIGAPRGGGGDDDDDSDDDSDDRASAEEAEAVKAERSYAFKDRYGAGSRRGTR